MKAQVVKLKYYEFFERSYNDLSSFISLLNDTIKNLKVDVIIACQWIDENINPKIIKQLQDDWLLIELNNHMYVISKSNYAFVGFTSIGVDNNYNYFVYGR